MKRKGLFFLILLGFFFFRLSGLESASFDKITVDERSSKIYLGDKEIVSNIIFRASGPNDDWNYYKEEYQKRYVVSKESTSGNSTRQGFIVRNGVKYASIVEKIEWSSSQFEITYGVTAEEDMSFGTLRCDIYLPTESCAGQATWRTIFNNSVKSDVFPEKFEEVNIPVGGMNVESFSVLNSARTGIRCFPDKKGFLRMGLQDGRRWNNQWFQIIWMFASNNTFKAGQKNQFKIIIEPVEKKEIVDSNTTIASETNPETVPAEGIGLLSSATKINPECKKLENPYQTDDQTILLFHFDQKEKRVVDSSGRDNHGNIYGAHTTIPGKFGTALSFNVNNSYVDCGNNESLNFMDKITVEAWIKPFFFPGSSDSGDARHRGIVWKNGSYGIKMIDNCIRGGVFVKNGGWLLVNSGKLPAANQWYHVAMTCDGEAVKLFINGVEQLGMSFVLSFYQDDERKIIRINESDSSCIIGRQMGNQEENFESFPGLIDEVRISNSVRKFCPDINLKTGQPANIFLLRKDPVRITVEAGDLKNNQNYNLAYHVTDYHQKTVEKGSISLRANQTSRATGDIILFLQKKGWFRIHANLENNGEILDKTTLDFAVIHPPESLSFKADSPFGFCGAGFYWMYPKDPEFLTKAKDDAEIGYLLGAKWFRIHSISWHAVEPKKGEFHWEFYDDIINFYRKYGFEIMVCLGWTPRWASRDKNDTAIGDGMHLWTTQSPNLDDYYNYVYTIVSRYKGRVKYWQITNEPPTSNFFNGTAHDYYQLVKTAYRAAKAADPSCAVVASSEAYSFQFVNDALSFGMGNYFDIMAAGDYNIEASRQHWRMILNRHNLDKPMLDPEILWYILRRKPGEIYHEKKIREEDIPVSTENLVKGYVESIAFGMKQIFEFGFFNFGDYLLSRTITPYGAAYRTMTHRLESTKYKGKTNSAEGVKCYLFEKGGNPIMVAWYEDIKGEKKVNLKISARKAKLVDIMDNEIEIPVRQGSVTLTLNREPVFIEGVE